MLIRRAYWLQDATDEILALGHSPFGSIFSGGNEGIIRMLGCNVVEMQKANSFHDIKKVRVTLRQWTIWGGKASEASRVFL